MNSKAVKILIAELGKLYPSPKCELEFENDYQLLVAVILSAQCTDKRVNAVCKNLFQVASTPTAMLDLGELKLKEIIKSCGFFNSKAKNIIAASKALVDNYNSKVPSDFNELISLRGVGEKTANVVLATAFKIPAIAVDTHVFRLSKRIGLCNEKSPIKTGHKLQMIIPKKDWIDLHYALVLHGRYVCKALKPDCFNCKINYLCKFARENKNV